MKDNNNFEVLSIVLAVAIILQFLSVYFFNYKYFENIGFAHQYGNFVLNFIKSKSFLFNNFTNNKLIRLIPIILVVFTSNPKKLFKIKYVHVITILIIGLICFFLPLNGNLFAVFLNSIGFVLLIVGGVLFNTVLPISDENDIFNKQNESFPQNEKKYTDKENIVNIEGIYKYKKKLNKVQINIVNIYRALLVLGTPGSGKTFAIILQYIKQLLEKGFSMYVYDYKYPTLAKLTIYFNKTFGTNKNLKIHIISFDDLPNSSRCNPLHPTIIESQLDAIDAIESVFFNMNRNWVSKQGDFFVMSPINYVSAILWWLRNYKNGEYCTFPHLLQLCSFSAQEIIPILQASGEVDNMISAFSGPLKMGAYEQLAGQISSAILSLSRLSDPAVYWVTSGNDFSLNINDPENPVLLIMGNNPLRQQVYSAALGLFHSRLVKCINQQNKLKCGFIMDELPTIFVRGLDLLIATARSNKIAVLLGIQDLEQLKRDYTDKEAMVLYNTIGNVFSGQTLGQTASMLSKRFGKKVQTKNNISFGQNNEPSFSINENLDYIIPEDTISTLSQGEFVGSIADDVKYPIELKTFNCKITVPKYIFEADENVKKMKFENMKNLNLDKLNVDVNENFYNIVAQVKDIVNDELLKIYHDPILNKKYLVEGFNYDFLD